MSDAMRRLPRCWFDDQSLSFAASLLGDFDVTMDEGRQYACASLICSKRGAIDAGLVSDSTLALLSTIHQDYWDADALIEEEFEYLPAVSSELAEVVRAARVQLEERDKISASGLNRMLVSHSVYLLKRQHFSARNLLTWLHRAVPNGEAIPGIGGTIDWLEENQAEAEQLEAALTRSRNPDRQTRDRLDDIDELHELVLAASGDLHSQMFPWWSRICMAYRSSLFAWPLLTDGNEDDATIEEGADVCEPDTSHNVYGTGLSLPISLFLNEDGKSTWKKTPNPWGQKIWYGYQLTRTEERDLGKAQKPRFFEGDDETPAHISGFQFGFSRQWWRSFMVSVDVAKKLWASQNGRLRYADEATAHSKLHASLNVDLRAASEIVNAVYSRIPHDELRMRKDRERYFVATGRSAEAYWVQCVLGLLLPGREIPMGLATGQVDYAQDEFEIRAVKGIVAKLEFANRAGFPRVVIPGDRSEFDEDDDSETDDDRQDVKEFLSKIECDNSRKTMEINFARTARAAADAMQPSGWRRTSFMRVPAFQRSFGYHQRRLFIRDAMEDQKTRYSLKKSDIDWYSNPKFGRKWFPVETNQLKRLDHLLLSNTGRSTRLVSSHALTGKVPGATVEETVAKWVAWRDNQVRTGELGYRGPGLGVLALRTAEGDHEVRIWAAIAEFLDASEEWWLEFQWSGLQKSAALLAELLCNQKADPKIASGSAPDLIIIFDDAGLTKERTNKIFPNQFSHQLYDLLNPRHKENGRCDFLDEALKKFGLGALAHETRIIIIHDDDAQNAISSGYVKGEPSELERSTLERLAIFRFGSSRQASFSMVNYARATNERLSWREFEELTQGLLADRMLVRSRNSLCLSSAARAMLGDFELMYDPGAHLHAAHSLCPILHPVASRVSGNRDRQLEPESVLEADWHLATANQLTPWRFSVPDWQKQSSIPSLNSSHALLTFLRKSPDWDTVKRLRVSTKTLESSVSLAQELMERESSVSGSEPSTSVIGLYIETLGRFFRNSRPAAGEIDGWAQKIEDLVQNAVARLDMETGLQIFERRRRLRHLFSRQLYALRALGLSFDDPRMRGGKAYIDAAVQEIIKPEFLHQVGESWAALDDYPISYDFWATAWADGFDDNRSLSISDRSTYAYAAARTNLPRPGQRMFSGGRYTHEPWIAYFSLTNPEHYHPAQFAQPLCFWDQIYGGSDHVGAEFARRALALQKHALPPSRRGRPWRENWSKEVQSAVQNLWHFVTHTDRARRLTGKPAGVAIQIIRHLALTESLPAFSFLSTCEASWIRFWPAIGFGPIDTWPAVARPTYGMDPAAWIAMARDVLRHNAGWIAMLGSLDSWPDHEDRVAIVQNWVQAFRRLDRTDLLHSDPEQLLMNASSLPLVEQFKACARNALANADSVFEIRNDRGFAIYGENRRVLSQCKGSITF